MRSIPNLILQNAALTMKRGRKFSSLSRHEKRVLFLCVTLAFCAAHWNFADVACIMPRVICLILQNRTEMTLEKKVHHLEKSPYYFFFVQFLHVLELCCFFNFSRMKVQSHLNSRCYYSSYLFPFSNVQSIINAERIFYGKWVGADFVLFQEFHTLATVTKSVSNTREMKNNLISLTSKKRKRNTYLYYISWIHKKWRHALTIQLEDE